MGNNNGAFRYSNAHSNSTVSGPFKTEHSAFKAVVPRVTLPNFCDSCYICDSRYDVQDSMVWCKKTIIVTISSSTIRRRRITTFNASFHGFISVWRKIQKCFSLCVPHKTTLCVSGCIHKVV